MDWTKLVTIHPPNEVKFEVHEAAEAAQDQKAVSKIQIINKSSSFILFKVSGPPLLTRSHRSRLRIRRTIW